MFDAICIGSSSFDVLYKTDKAFVLDNPKKGHPDKLLAVEFGAKLYSEDVFFGFGGGGSNVAVGLSKMGLKTSLISRLGKDEQAQSILENLKKQKVKTSLIQEDAKHKTAFSFIVSQKEYLRDRTIFVHRGANDHLLVSKKAVKQAKYIVVSSLGSNWEQNLKNILASHADVAWNPSAKLIKQGKKKIQKYISQLKVLSVNKDEAYHLALLDEKFQKLSEKNKEDAEVILVTLQSWGPHMVVITDGQKGAYGCNGTRCVSMPIRRNGELVDKTGAGDAFFSGFVAGLHYFGDLEKAMKVGMANGHSVIQKIGAQNGLLSLNQAKKDMRHY